jgi:hypothetical protein
VGQKYKVSPARFRTTPPRGKTVNGSTKVQMPSSATVTVLRFQSRLTIIDSKYAKARNKVAWVRA